MDTEYKLLLLAAIERAAKSEISDAEFGAWVRITIKTIEMCDEAVDLDRTLKLLKMPHSPKQ